MNLKANWGVSSRAIPRYETMDEAGYLETIFQSYKNNQIINGGVSPELAGVAALEAMKSGSTAMLGQNEQYNPFNYSITELIDPVTGKVRSDAKLRYSEDWMDEALKSNPLRQEYVASFSGGSDKTKYMFSLGYLDEEGLLKTKQKNRTGNIAHDSVIGSKANAYINAGVQLNWMVSRQIDLIAGVTGTHFSNGNTKFPNAGLNTMGIESRRCLITSTAGRCAYQTYVLCACTRNLPRHVQRKVDPVRLMEAKRGVR